MNIMVAADANWAIGYQNKLLVRIPNDHKRMREQTTGKVIVMGRKTLESFPQGQPLKNRTNIVLTTDKSYSVNGVTVVHSIDELKEELRQYNSEDIYVFGGESVYRQLLDLCDTAYVTKINYSYQADTYFPKLDENDDWELVSESEEQTYFDLEYTFLEYKRKNVDF